LVMSDTNAIKWLRTQGVRFEVLEYEFSKVGADLAAAAVGRPLEAVCKTLIVQAEGRSFWVAIVPGDQRFDTRKMAAAIGAKTADLASNEDAERGQRVPDRGYLAVRHETQAADGDRGIAHGVGPHRGEWGQAGVLVELAAEELVRLTEARAAGICG